MAYVSYTGSYSSIGPVMAAVEKTLANENIKVTQGIGIYYDDPAATPVNELKSEIGMVVDPVSVNLLAPLEGKYLVKTLPQAKSVVATFPLKNILSYFIAPMKIYPIMNAYMSGHNINMNVPRIEIYDQNTKEIIFIAAISK